MTQIWALALFLTSFSLSAQSSPFSAKATGLKTFEIPLAFWKRAANDAALVGLLSALYLHILEYAHLGPLRRVRISVCHCILGYVILLSSMVRAGNSKRAPEAAQL